MTDYCRRSQSGAQHAHDGSHDDIARKNLSEQAAPAVRNMGAAAAFWLAAQEGRGVCVAVFDNRESAAQLAGLLKVGEPDLFVPGVTFRTVEVREVLVSV